MHELLLFGTVVQSTHTQILHALAGLTAMAPQPLLESHTIYKPTRSFSDPSSSSIVTGSFSQQQSQQSATSSTTSQTHSQLSNLPRGDLFYLQAVRDETQKSRHRQRQQQHVKDNDNNDTEGRWTLQFRDLPEPPGRRPVMSRLIYDVPIDGGNSNGGSRKSSHEQEFMAGMGYAPVTKYALRGQRFTYDDWVNVRVYRISIPNDDDDEEGSTTAANDQQQSGVTKGEEESAGVEKGKQDDGTTIEESSNGKGKQEKKESLLDASGAYVMEASVKVRDGQDLKTMSKGVEELVAFRDVMRGCVDLEVGDRLSLDTRVRMK